MCLVSLVVQGAHEQFPPVNQWPYQQTVDMSEVLKKLSEIDKKLGSKDCHDPIKNAFLQQLVDRITALEKAQASR